MKGIGIILVVIGHSSCRLPYVNQVIYSFHMPLFFIASGLFFQERALSSKKSFVKKKVKGLYLPYLKWSLIFLILHNVFFEIGIINDSYGTKNWVSHLYTWKMMVYKAFNITFRMTDYEPIILGAYWFMRSLFVGLLLLCFFSWLFERLTKSAFKALLWVTILFGLAGGVVAYFEHPIPYIPQGGYRELMAVFFIGCGFFLSRFKYCLQSNITLILTLSIFVLCIIIHPTNMDYTPTFLDWLILPFSGLSGFIITYRVSHAICGCENKVLYTIQSFLKYAGEKSLYILTFHFLMFRPAALLYSYIYDLDWRIIGTHPVPHMIDENWYWVVYSSSSIVLSLFLERALNSRFYFKSLCNKSDN